MFNVPESFGVSGVSYIVDLDNYMVQLYVDSQCSTPVEIGTNPNAQCRKTSDEVRWELTPLPCPTVRPVGNGYAVV